MPKPTEAMDRYIALLRARRDGVSPAGMSPAGISVEAQDAAPATRLGSLAAPGGPTPIHIATAGPAPVARAAPPAVSLGHVGPVASGAPGVNATLASGDALAGSIQAQAAAPPSPAPPGDSTARQFGAGLWHGANGSLEHLGSALDRASDYIDDHVPGMASLDHMVGHDSAKTRENAARLAKDDGDYQTRYGDSNVAFAGNVAGQVALAAATGVAGRGTAVADTLIGAAGRTAATEATGAVPTAAPLMSAAARTAAVNGGIGAGTGGVTGYESGGLKGALVGAVVGGGANILAPGLAGRVGQSLGRATESQFVGSVGAGTVYTAVNTGAGATAAIATNLASGDPWTQGVGMSALIGAVAPVLSGDTLLTGLASSISKPLTAAAARTAAQVELPELAGYALTAQTGVFSVAATTATTYHAAHQDEPKSGLYVGSNAILPEAEESDP